MEHKYALDEFWIQKLEFKRRVDAAAFANLHEIRNIVNYIFLLVVRNNLGPKEVAEWQENLVFIEYLATNLGSQSHSWAMQKLKEVFGGKQGMSSCKKSLADKIVKQTSQRTQGMPPRCNYLLPQQYFGGGLGMMAGLCTLYLLDLCNILLPLKVDSLPDLLLGRAIFVNNKGIWQRIALFPMANKLEETMQKVEDLRGMAKGDRLFFLSFE